MSDLNGQEPTVIAPSREPTEPVYQLIPYAGAVEEGRHDHLWDVTWANQFNGTRRKEATLTTLQIKELVDADRHVQLPELEIWAASGVLPWALLVAGSVASLAANVAVAEPTVIGRVLAAWLPHVLLCCSRGRSWLKRKSRACLHLIRPRGQGACGSPAEPLGGSGDKSMAGYR
jgi:hypothetical protein